MKILVYSDLQADLGQARLRSNPNVPLQHWRTQRFYTAAAAVARQFGVEGVWDLGDTTNNRSAIAIPTIEAVGAGSATLTSGLSRAHCLKLVGNHEQVNKSVDDHCGALFSPYFNVIEDRAVIGYGSTSVVALSFPYDNREAAEWLCSTVARLKNRHQRVVVIGHAKITGCRMNSGLAEGGLPQESYAQADLALFGHVHKWQRIGSNGYYVGSPFQQDFGEASDPPKVVGILDFATLAVQWIHLRGFPAHRTVPVAEAIAAIKTDDILSVTISSQEEAEVFYRLPSTVGVEPVYALERADQVEGEDAEAGSQRSFDEIIADYAATVAGPAEPAVLVEAAAKFK